MDFAIRKQDRPNGPSLCPCCQLPVHAGGHQVVGDTKNVLTRQQSNAVMRDSLVSLFSEDVDQTCDEDMDETDRMMPGVLGKGVAYTVKEVIAQGYVHKKGSGNDFLGSRSWKPRWAVLVWASVEGNEGIDLPLLQIFWTSTSPTASTVISLDSAVVIPENLQDNSNAFRFMIRHLRTSVSDSDSTLQMTRLFSCPKEARDDWVYAINHALLEYEKAKASARRLGGILTPTSSLRVKSIATSASAPISQPRDHPRLSLPL
ncbi:MAG: hypothetical protein SGILL_000090 [Bacillariaceae sp.]